MVTHLQHTATPDCVLCSCSTADCSLTCDKQRLEWLHGKQDKAFFNDSSSEWPAAVYLDMGLDGVSGMITRAVTETEFEETASALKKLVDVAAKEQWEDLK